MLRRFVTLKGRRAAAFPPVSIFYFKRVKSRLGTGSMRGNIGFGMQAGHWR